MKMNLKINAMYTVSKSSNNGTFKKGEMITLRVDGCLWAGDECVEPADLDSATEGMEVELLWHMPPQADAEWRNLLRAVRGHLDSLCYECESASAARFIDEVFDGRKE